MVAYFKLQNNLFMALGAAAGLLAALLSMSSLMQSEMLFLKLFMIMLFVLIGVVLGRLLSSIWANKRLRELNHLLYQRCDPAAFLEKFVPIAAKVPVTTAEHVDAQTKIAFAHEALGQLDQGLEALKDLKPQELKLHALQCTALTANQMLRLYLLKEDCEAAAEKLKELEQVQETASVRAPTLGRNLAECIRLGQNWLNVLQDEECDLDYLREEITLSQNRIHKSEMQLLLGRALMNCGRFDEALDLYGEAAATAPDLYAGQQAMALLKT